MQPTSRVLFGAFVVCAAAQGQVAFAGPDSSAKKQESADPQPLNTAPTTTDTPVDAAPVTAVPPAPSPDAATVPAPVDPTVAPVTTDTNGVTASAETNIDLAPAPDRWSYAWHERGLSTGIGVAAILGGGVTGFTDKAMRSTTADVGGLWDLRVTIGSHVPLALDLSYVGTATDIGGMPSGQSATLIGTTAEAALRYNVLPHNAINPYVFAGAGWQHYDVNRSGGAPQLTGMADNDDLLEFPVGTGVSYRRSGFVADLRGTFRAATDENLVVVPTTTGSNSNFAPMHTWEASAALGYEF
jgi:hypothetical protein